MALFKDAEQLKTVLQRLFDRISDDEVTVRALAQSHLIIRLNITQPAAAVVFNGRKNPPAVTYGPTNLLPDLDIQLSADALHKILLREIRLTHALTTGELKVRGPVWKSFVMEDIFHGAQALYPQLLREMGM